MKIAIVGAGISGLTAAYYLAPRHQLTLFEASDRIGGHTATVEVDHGGRRYAIDTGFIVYNDWTYPNFIELMDRLGVASKPTEMSFSVRCEQSGLEYGGNNLNTLFAQRRNLLRPRFHRMLRDILRFNREVVADHDRGRIAADTRLGEYLRANDYGEAFVHQYLLPMGCAIWSASIARMTDFPLLFFVRFFRNHGLLSVNHRPQWRVIEGGSNQYLRPLTNRFADSIRLNARISSIRRSAEGVQLEMVDGTIECFDQLLMACHSDQALQLLSDASSAELGALSAIPYQDNEMVLHHDEKLLPRSHRAWSSWNYWLKNPHQQQAVLTYNMNILQQLEAHTTFCVTMNATSSIDPEKIIQHFNYSHPVFSLESVAAVAKIEEINGINRTWYAGAYLGNGFHEDGVVSGRTAAEAMNRAAPAENGQPPSASQEFASA